MAVTEHEFFEDAREWSSRKMNIIEKYLNGFATILGKGAFSSLVYIDGFAGKGMYGEGEKCVEGSPVRAAKLASEKYPDVLRCILVEKDDENFADLKRHTAPFSRWIEIYHGEFSEWADNIINRIGKKAALVFLDAFGVKGADWETVCKFVSRPHITDVWIRFDHRTIRRLDGFVNSTSKDAKTKTALLGEHFGISDPDLLHSLLDAPTQEQRILKAVTLYQTRLMQVMGENGFVGAYPIISLNGEKKYHLLFACKNKKAAILANDVINTVEDDLPIKQAEYAEQIRLQRTGQIALFDNTPSPDEIFNQKVVEIKRYVLQWLPAQADVQTIHYELFRQNPNWFGTFRQKHLTRVLNELKTEGWITLQGAASKSETKVARLR